MMRREYDYSKYEHSEYEKYSAQWKGYRDVSLGYFNNDVYCRPDSKCFLVVVDDYHEHAYMDKLYNEIECTLSDAHTNGGQEKTDAHVDIQKKEIAEVINRYQGVFDVNIDESKHPLGYDKPLLNYFSGTQITIPLGEGILNFCYAEFNQALEKAKPLYYLLTGELGEAFNRGMQEYDDNGIKTSREVLDTHDPEPLAGHEQEPEPIRNHVDETIIVFEQYTNTISVLSNVFYCCLYTAIFPPVFLQQTLKALEYYVNYIHLLQSEFLELIQFCFDESFYPEVLGNLYPAERYGLYCHIKNRPPYCRRTEVFATSLHLSGEKMPYGITHEELTKRINQNITLTKVQKAFAEKYGLDPEYLEYRYRFPLFINTAYECSTVRDMLYLEFTKILEQNIQFKKCKRCNRYFIMKGNYPGEYCDRVSDGETRTCQQLAAQDNYKTKLKTSSAWGVYNKYYKRYFARTKVGSIKPPIFKQWQYAAVLKRDECLEGTLSLEEYTTWLEASFPNRKKESNT